MRMLVAALVLLLSCGAAAAQGCGSQNPNCALPAGATAYTQPQGDSTTSVATDAFVERAVNGGSTGTPNDFPVYNSAGTGFIDSDVPLAPIGGMPLYAAPSATGTGNCLSSGNACTLATACLFVKQIATFLVAVGPINLANGTYNTIDPGTLSLCPILGNSGGSSSQLISIVGNTLSPASVILAVPASDIGIYVKDGGETAVSGFTVTLGSGASGIQNAGQGSVVDYGNVVWSTSGSNSVHVSGAGGSYTNLDSAGETITANFNQHWNFTGNAQFSAGGVTAISNSTTFTDFLIATGTPYLNLSAWSFTGTSLTGVRAVLTGPGYMVTAAAASCASVLPGTGGGGCSISLGFQDNAGDGMSGTGIVVGKQQPTINDPIIGSQTYSSLPASPTAGQIDHIVDGLAANCGDGTCTTPGATVTGGTGAVDLLIGYDGAAWRIFRAQAVPALANLSGTLAVNKGGTGVTTITGAIKGNGASPFSQAACADLSNDGTLCTLGVGTGLASSGGNLNSNAQTIEKFSPGLVASVVNTKGNFTKWTKAATVDNIEGSATSFTCVGNPTITFYECGTSTTCASSPVTIGSVTVTAGGTVVDGTVSNPAITAGDYTAWAVSAGTCTSLDIFGSANIHSN